MTDIADKILGVTGSVSCLVSYVFYRLYRNRTETARQVKNIHIWQADEDLLNHLSQEGVLAYAAVEGVVKELGRTLQSNHGHHTGVIRQSQLTEHKSQRIHGFWSDVKKTIRDSLEYVPFALIPTNGKGGKHQVEIVEPAIASCLKDELDTTYDRFEPNKSTLIQIGMDRLMGEVTKGIQESERMLLSGTSLLGIGKLVLDRGQIKLTPPEDSNQTYILTKMHLSQLVRNYESQSSTYKVVAVVAALIGGGLFTFIVWRHLRSWVEKYKQRRQFDEIRRSVRDAAVRRQTRRTDADGDNRDDEAAVENSCVVCLSNPRQVVTLNCGHISMCTDCAEALPMPKKCPVCRASVERFLPVFHP